MEITLIHWTGSLLPSYIAARTCNSKLTPQQIQGDSFDRLNDSPDKEGVMAHFLKTRCLDHGHFSVIEHISFTFGISGVSRSFLAQQATHRIISRSVQSQRYVNMEDFDFVIPPSIKAEEEDYDNFKGIMDALSMWYSKFVKNGRPKEDARYILPNAACTNMVITANGRALIEMGRKRLCNRAQWEIRDVFSQIKALVEDACPLIASYMASPCTFGPCPEGEHSCKK